VPGFARIKAKMAPGPEKPLCVSSVNLPRALPAVLAGVLDAGAVSPPTVLAEDATGARALDDGFPFRFCRGFFTEAFFAGLGARGRRTVFSGGVLGARTSACRHPWAAVRHQGDGFGERDPSRPSCRSGWWH